MKFMTGKKYLYTAKMDSFTTSVGTGGTVTRNYTYLKDIHFVGGLTFGSNLYLFTPEALPIFYRLHDLRDVDGELLTDNVYEVRTCAPLLNAYGHREDYKSNVTKV